MRVLTWNLWWRFGDWRARHAAIAAVLEREQPDVCCLQEVWATGAANQAADLAARAGMEWTWVPSPRPEKWQRRLDGETEEVGIGNAVLSRWPLTGIEHADLPAAGADDEGRTVLHASVLTPDGPVPVFTTQLNSGPGQSAVRCQQVRSISRFVDAHVHGGSHPAVLTGDFNAQPDSDEVRLMEGHLTAPAVPGLLLVDAWRYADPGDPGLTWDHRRNPHVRPTLEPSGRIDYLFVGPPGPGGAGHVRSVRLVGHGPEDGVWPSDHAGVVADLAPGVLG